MSGGELIDFLRPAAFYLVTVGRSDASFTGCSTTIGCGRLKMSMNIDIMSLPYGHRLLHKHHLLHQSKGWRVVRLTVEVLRGGTLSRARVQMMGKSAGSSMRPTAMTPAFVSTQKIAHAKYCIVPSCAKKETLYLFRHTIISLVLFISSRLNFSDCSGLIQT